eukprot:TRINITY_DN5707_c0_g1_i4.p1 TRINITY_DN5707_c0_g1~~TRINITY_DN5707_c0_g1_i4.p1  ORF type:complete len:294 (+),score=24.39 TRINITY_DN5707_c0_g1_i4:99-980(+)
MKKIVLFFIVTSVCAGSLKFVIHISNIGAHFPYYLNSSWGNPTGALTHIGMRQLYLLGRELRKQYIEDLRLLPEQFASRSFSLRAVADPSLAATHSAQAFTAGLFPAGTGYCLTRREIERAVPPGNTYEEGEGLRDEALVNYYTSVPVVVHGGGADYVLAAQDNCVHLSSLMEEHKRKNSTLMERIAAKEQEYSKTAFKELSEQFKTNINTMEEALKYYDYILAARYYEHDINEKISNKTEEQLKETYSLYNYEIKFVILELLKQYLMDCLQRSLEDLAIVCTIKFQGWSLIL